ncbi:branched-chain amino acid ABC transporter permease [Sphingomonas sp. IBVSS2]|nr:branched-chain amino acid ABC transporter permease [Sphingomonas sp. IBVSS2]
MTQGRSVPAPVPGSRAELARGLRASLPVMIGFVPFALVLGAQASAKGLSALEVPILTGLNFGGGSEFAAIGLWTSPPHLLLIGGVTMLVNCRHLLMGAAFAPYLRHLSRRQALPALFFMCDESWAMGLADARLGAEAGRSQPFSLAYYFGVSIGLYATWVVFTALGALLGPVLGDITRYGFDMAFPAVFLVLLRGMWKGARAAMPWAASLAVAVAVHLLVPGAWYVPAGAVAGVLAACAWARP